MTTLEQGLGESTFKRSLCGNKMCNPPSPEHDLPLAPLLGIVHAAERVREAVHAHHGEAAFYLQPGGSYTPE